MFKDQSIGQLVESGLLREHETVDHLPSYTYYYRIDQQTLETVFVAKREDDPVHEYYEASFQFLPIFDQNDDFWNKIFDNETSKKLSRCFGIITRDGRIVFSDNGNHHVLSLLFDDRRLLDFLQTFEDVNNKDKVKVTLLTNNIENKGTVDDPIPSYAELMQSILFFVDNYFKTTDQDGKSRKLECDVHVRKNDGTFMRFKQKRTYYEWKEYLRINGSFIKQYQELKPPFSTSTH